MNIFIKSLTCALSLGALLGGQATTAVAQLKQFPADLSGKLIYAVYDQNIPDRIYATDSRQLYVSEDRCTTWRIVYRDESNGMITKIKSYAGSNLVFFTVRGSITSRDALGLYSLNSVTGELKHYITPNQDQNYTVQSYDVSADGSKIVVYTSYTDPSTYEYTSEVFLTSDNGASWGKIYDFRKHHNIHPKRVLFSPDNSDKIYLTRADGPAGSRGGLLMSSDCGSTWTECLDGIVLGPIAINPANSDELLVGVDSKINQQVYHSTDGGITWKSVSGINWTDGLLEGVKEIQFSPDDPNRVYVFDSNQLIVSADGLKTMQDITPANYCYGHYLSINPFNTGEMLLGMTPNYSADAVATTSDELRTLSILPEAAISSPVDGIAIGNGTQLFYLRNGVCYDKDLQSDSEKELQASGYDRMFAKSCADNLIFIANSKEGKLALTDFSDDPEIYEIDGVFNDVTSIARDSENDMIFWIAANGSLLRADASNKENIVVANIGSPITGGAVSDICMSSGKIYIAGGNHIYSSDNGGAQWKNVSSGLGAQTVLTLGANDDSSIMIATTVSESYISHDNGTTWSQLPLKASNVRDIAFSSASRGTIAAASYDKNQPSALHYSTDNGLTWRTISPKALHYANAADVAFEFSSDGKSLTAHIASSDMGRLAYNVSLEESIATINQYPFIESFENGGIPLGWQQSGSASAKWEASALDAIETTAVFESDDRGEKSRLITPAFDLSGLESPLLSFDYSINEGFLKVLYQNSDNGNWIEIPMEAQSGTHKVEIPLPLKSPNYHIAFEAESAGNTRISIDCVTICEQPVRDRNEVRNLAVSMSFGPEAIVSWTAPEGNYKGVYNVYRDNIKIAGPIESNEFTDKGFAKGTHIWTVKTVYDGAETSGAQVTDSYSGEYAPIKCLEVAISNSVTGDALAALEWGLPENYDRALYNVYRDGEKIASEISESRYTDSGMTNGKHSWSVCAVYGENESARESVDGEILNRCTPVRALEASYDVKSEEVSLLWGTPGGLPEDYIGHAGMPAKSIGYSESGVFRMNIASRWSAEELAEMGVDGARLTEIAFVPWSRKANYALRLYTGGDGKKAGSEIYVNVAKDGTELNIGEWNSLKLTNPVVINASEELWIGYQVLFSGPDDIIGCDAGPEIAGVNMISDGSKWYTSSEFDPAYANANFCISARIEGADGQKILNRSMRKAPEFSYNIYRNGELIAKTTETGYKDSGNPEDYYTYSVTSVDNIKGESAKRDVTIFAGNRCPKVENLSASVDEDNQDITLSWDAADPYFIDETSYNESFDEELPDSWRIIDNDGDGLAWASSANPYGNYPPAPLSGQCMMSVSKNYTFNPETFSSTMTMADNWLVMPQTALTENDTELKFNVSQLYNFSHETKYEVLISTTGNEPEDFSSIFSETLGQSTVPVWYKRSVDLSDYSGQTVYIAFRHLCDNEKAITEGLQLDEVAIVESRPVERSYNIYRDNEQIARNFAETIFTDSSPAHGSHNYSVRTVCEDLGYESHPSDVAAGNSGLGSVRSSRVTVYPNPATDYIHIESDGEEVGSVTLSDMSGRIISHFDFPDSGITTLDVSDLSQGLYILSVGEENVKIIKK